MKTCKKCGESKSPEEFYKHPDCLDGRQEKCKECAKAASRANRREKADYYREYERARWMDPDRRASVREYLKSSRARDPERHNGYSYRWRARNPDKRRAHIAVGNAIRDGKMNREPCEACGETSRVQAHHDDYSKPLDVRWLCVACHAAHHSKDKRA